LTGQVSVKRYIPHLLEHIRAGRIKPQQVFTHRLPLERAAEGYHTFEHKHDGCIKVALFPNGAPH
jgi:threonine dehydrogenase-like Zn-dependent dehydrogenase